MTLRHAPLTVAAVFFSAYAALAGERAPEASEPAARAEQTTRAAEAAAEELTSSQLFARKKLVKNATVVIPVTSCAGFLVRRHRVVTAAHCIPERATRLSVRLRSGRIMPSSLEHLDRDRDLALLELDRPVDISPLEMSARAAKPGDGLLFVGRADRRSRTQIATVERVGTCPTLPEIDDALFTDLEARPGDSGAPLIDAHFRVVALVHGGARCHIAAPVAPLARHLEAHSRADPPTLSVAPDGSASAEQSAGESDDGTPRRQFRIGGLLIEETEGGYRVRWSFSWSFGSDD